MPQGSVLGPVLFTTYTLPLSDVIRHFGLPYYFSADDSQLHENISSLDLHLASDMNVCIENDADWMQTNKLNPGSTVPRIFQVALPPPQSHCCSWNILGLPHKVINVKSKNQSEKLLQLNSLITSTDAFKRKDLLAGNSFTHQLKMCVMYLFSM